MSYQALYRKWRPKTFEDVKGQDHIVTTLKNQIAADRIGHAYLFCGTRGTGKTSVAKIFAKAVNCKHPVNGSPCNECEMCRAINEQSSMNVIEIDAASNNGVDNIREIRDEVEYSPTDGRFKVYIIDEVHMLSIGAFNALLKTLEEPPAYVIFILATTEVHKIPITILSRCQRYDFKRITNETIADRLFELIDYEKLDVEEKAVRYVAKAADGSMRDALSLLDQCVAFYLGQKLTYDNVLEVLGAVDTEVFSKLLRSVIDQDICQAMLLLETVMVQGRELGQFVTDFTWYLRNLLLVTSSDDMEDILDISSDNLIRLKEEAKMINQDNLMRYVRIFADLSNQIRYSTQKRVLIELALIKLCKPQMENDYEAILNRISNIEKQIEHGIALAPQRAQNSGAVMPQLVEEPSKPLEKALPKDVMVLIERWPQIISELPTPADIMMREVKVSQGNNNQILLAFSDQMKYGYFSKEENLEVLEKVISERIQKEVSVSISKITEEDQKDDIFIDPAKIRLDGVEIIDEDE